jgi:hypothetical protein
LPKRAAQQRISVLPQRGADENGLATVNLVCTLQFAKIKNRKHIQMQKAALWRREKKLNKTATSTQSHQPASTSISEVLAGLYPYNPNILVPHPGARPDCIKGATLAGERMVRTQSPIEFA